MKIRIREYVQEDLGDIIRIYNEAFKNLRSSWANPMTMEWFINRFGDELKGGTAFTAVSDDERIGYVLITSERRLQVGLVVYISGICVVPNHQRKGLGTRLVQRALDWARSENAVLVENDDEIVENPVAVKFFEKLGFRIFQNGVYMSKDLKLPDEFVLFRSYEVREHRQMDLDDLLRIRNRSIDRRGGGSLFLKDVASHPDFIGAAKELNTAAKLFENTSRQMEKWWEIVGQIWDDEEKQIKAVADHKVRAAFVPVIQTCRKNDEEAVEKIEIGLNKLN